MGTVKKELSYIKKLSLITFVLDLNVNRMMLKYIKLFNMHHNSKNVYFFTNMLVHNFSVIIQFKYFSPKSTRNLAMNLIAL